MAIIKKAAKEKLTAGRIAKFQCEAEKEKSYLWCEEVKGFGIVARATGAKSYIFQAKVNGKSMRLTIGDVGAWNIAKAQAEARRLQTVIDSGNDPRQVKAEAIATKEAKATAQREQEARESATVNQAWQDYLTERNAAIKDGKPVWCDRYKQQHIEFTRAGGVKRKRGAHNGETLTREGMLAPFMAMRLKDITPAVIAEWLEKETSRAPTSAHHAFRAFRAFLTWCAKHPPYDAAIQAEVCYTDTVKSKVPTVKTKPNDSLRRAQIAPWFEEVRKINNQVISAYLQGLLLTGARRRELSGLQWKDVDFKWNSLTIHDKVEGLRIIPLTPYLGQLLDNLPRRNEYVFSSPTAASGKLEEPRIQHKKALAAAALPDISIHALRRSFGTLAEWVEVPAGIVAQIMGHKPSATAEKHYIQRELDLLSMWHVKIEAWILNEAGIQLVPVKAGLKLVSAN